MAAVLLLLAALGGVWWFQKGDLGEYRRFCALNDGHSRRMRFRLWLVRAALVFLLPVLVGLALTNFDKVYLLKVATIVEFGYYSLAFTTSRLIGVLYDAMNTALYSRYAGKEEGELSRSINMAFRFTLLPMLLLAALGAVLAP